MSEYEQARSYEYVILVDRARQGGCEIIHDGYRTVFAKGEVERPVPQFLAEWLFRVDQQKVHTTDGQYIQRFGIKNPSLELTQRMGGDVGDISPIEIDTTRLEGWDSDRYAERSNSRTIQLARRPDDYANVATPTTFGKER